MTGRAWMIVLVLAARVVSAQPALNIAAAKTEFERGKAFVAASKFDDAYGAFEAAYQASRRPAFLFNMAEAARAMGDVARARAAYERFIAAEPTGTLADTARQRLTELPPAPTPAPVPVPAAPPVVAAPAPQIQSTVHVPSPETAARSRVELPTPDWNMSLTQPHAEARTLWRRWPFWAAVGGVAVAAIVTTVVVVAVHGHEQPACTSPSCVVF